MVVRYECWLWLDELLKIKVPCVSFPAREVGTLRAGICMPSKERLRQMSRRGGANAPSLAALDAKMQFWTPVEQRDSGLP